MRFIRRATSGESAPAGQDVNSTTDAAVQQRPRLAVRRVTVGVTCRAEHEPLPGGNQKNHCNPCETTTLWAPMEPSRSYAGTPVRQRGRMAASNQVLPAVPRGRSTVSPGTAAAPSAAPHRPGCQSTGGAGSDHAIRCGDAVRRLRGGNQHTRHRLHHASGAPVRRRGSTGLEPARPRALKAGEAPLCWRSFNTPSASRDAPRAGTLRRASDGSGSVAASARPVARHTLGLSASGNRSVVRPDRRVSRPHLQEACRPGYYARAVHWVWCCRPAHCRLSRPGTAGVEGRQ